MNYINILAKAAIKIMKEYGGLSNKNVFIIRFK